MKKIIITDRLEIRELCKEDFKEVYSMNTDPEVMKYHFADGKTRTLKQEATIFRNILKGYSHNDSYGIWAVVTKSENTFIGVASLLPLKETGEPQAGVRINKLSWNKGFGSEIMMAIIDYGIFKLKLSRVVALTNLDNQPSIKMLEKAGFKWEKKLKVGNAHMNYYAINQFSIA